MTSATTELKLYDYQEYGVKWLLAGERGRILADDMGLGKTVEVVSALRRGSFKRTLIITLNSVRRVWQSEIPKWWPDVRFVVIDPYTMTKSQREDAILDKSNRIVVVSYEMMLRLNDTLLKVFWDVTIWDEAQKLRNRDSQTHKKHRLLVRKSNCGLVWHLTGTPVNNHQVDYWPMLRDFAPGFGSYWQFAYNYCDVETIYPPKYQSIVDQCKRENRPIPPSIQRAAYGQVVSNVTDPNDPRTKELVNAIRPHVLRRTKEQVFPEMPAKTIQIVPVELDSVHRRMYTQLETKMSTKLPNDQEILVDTEMALTTRLLQMSTDWRLLTGEECRDYPLAGAKADALVDSIESLDGEPFVVFSQWSRVIDMARNLVGTGVCTTAGYTGENVKTRDAELDAWLAGHRQGLFVTTSAGGVGLDFTRASYAFFLDRSWNPKLNEQAEDRLHRHGQNRPVLIRVFQSIDTIESNDQALSIDLKERVSQNIVEALVE